MISPYSTNRSVTDKPTRPSQQAPDWVMMLRTMEAYETTYRENLIVLPVVHSDTVNRVHASKIILSSRQCVYMWVYFEW